MLYLRKYVTFLKTGTNWSVVSFHLHSLSYKSANFPSCKGYAYDYVHHEMDQTHLQSKNYDVTYMKTFSTLCYNCAFSTMVSESSIDDINHKLMSLCNDTENSLFSMNNLKKIVKFCTANDYQLNQSTSLVLLKCCGNLLSDLETTDKQILANEVWCLVKRNSKELTLEHYNTILDIYIKNSITIDLSLFLTNMNLKPDKNTYRLLLNATAKMNNSKHLENIIYMIKKNNISIDEDMFNELLQTYVNSNNITKAEHLITLIQTAELPATKIYTELACEYAKLGDIPNLVKILNDEPQNNQDLLRITKILSMSGNSIHIPVVLNFLTVSKPEYNSEISKTISELIHADRVVDAHTIINCLMTNNAIKNDMKCFVNRFLNELVIIDIPFNDIMKYVNDFMDSGYHSMTLISLLEIGLKLDRENLCFAIFETMRDRGIEIRPHYFWPLLITARRNEGEAKIFALVKSMVDLDVELDYDTFINYVYPYVNTVNPITVMQRLVKNNVSGHIAYTPLIIFLLSRNRLQDIKLMYMNNIKYKMHCKNLMEPLTFAYVTTRNVKDCIELLMLFPNGIDFVSYFLALVLKDKSVMYIDLKLILEELKKHDAEIPQQDADNLINKLMNRDFNYAENMNVSKLIKSLVNDRLKESALTLFLHRKYLNKNELIYNLVELKSKGFNCRGTLRQLLIMYYNENNLKKVEEIKREFDAYQYKWTNNMKEIVFKSYLIHNKLAEAEAFLQASSTTLLTANSIVLFAIALVKAGNIIKAFKVIEAGKTSTQLQGDDRNCHKNCCILLQTLAHTEHYSHTKKMLAMLLEKKYCNLKMELLKPLVAIPLERNDILGALDVFTKCMQRYHKIPLSLEILIALLRNRDNPKLPKADKYIEDVYQIIANIAGLLVANTLLVIALATLNKTHELQAILQKENISIEYLSYYKYSQTNDYFDALWTLFKAMPNTNNLNQLLLCEMLLNFYNKTGNFNKALELRNVMYEKNIKPTEQFEHNFTQFLLVNKIPIPPKFEQRQSKMNINIQ